MPDSQEPEDPNAPPDADSIAPNGSGVKKTDYVEVVERIMALMDAYADDSYRAANKVVLLANSGGIAAVIGVGKIAEGPSLQAALSFAIGLLVAGAGPIATACQLWLVQRATKRESIKQATIGFLAKKIEETASRSDSPVDLDRLDQAVSERPDMKSSFWPIPIASICFVAGAIFLFVSVFA